MILAIDAGTTGVTCLVVGAELRTVGRGARPEPAPDRDGIEQLRSGWRVALRRMLLR